MKETATLHSCGSLTLPHRWDDTKLELDLFWRSLRVRGWLNIPVVG
jgi:hypothetical protein